MHVRTAPTTTVMTSAASSSQRKARKSARLRRPMALPTQGQKWSNCSMHRSVAAQCLARSGRTMRHVTHSCAHHERSEQPHQGFEPCDTLLYFG